ncbi:hypothetical protein JG687_00014496 [Phytophthora cactorum]|uniref:Uncharacterized protein n=1 Tax=Phytophthora cactorum TaxID=29920 RepID=A0A8T1U0Q4_9STRA|nr:hypothetical protein JG687_00014496 [Phytophthora cactorum]
MSFGYVGRLSFLLLWSLENSNPRNLKKRARPSYKSFLMLESPPRLLLKQTQDRYLDLSLSMRLWSREVLISLCDFAAPDAVRLCVAVAKTAKTHLKLNLDDWDLTEQLVQHAGSMLSLILSGSAVCKKKDEAQLSKRFLLWSKRLARHNLLESTLFSDRPCMLSNCKHQVGV